MKKKMKWFSLLTLLLIPFLAGAALLKLSNVIVKEFDVDKIYKDHLEISLRLQNTSSEPEDVNINFVFLDKNENVLRKDNERKLTVEGLGKKILFQKELKGLHRLDKIKLSLSNDNGEELAGALVENLNKSLENVGYVGEDKKNTCQLKDDLIQCQEIVGDPTLIQVYKNNTFGKKVISEENPWVTVDGKSQFKLPKLDIGKYEIEVYIEGRESKYFNYIVGDGKYALVEHLGLKKTDSEKDSKEIILSVDKNINNDVEVVYGLIDQNGVCFTGKKKVRSGFNTLKIKDEKKCKGEVKPYTFILDDKGQVLDKVNTGDKKLEDFTGKKKEKELKPLKKEEVENPYVKYIQYLIYVAVGLLLIGLILWFVNKTFSIAVIILALILFGAFFGYQKLFAMVQQDKWVIVENNTILQIAKKDKYQKNENVKIGVLFLGSGKLNDTKMLVKLDDGKYQERIKYDHRSPIYNINLSKLPEGEHMIFFKPIYKAKFTNSIFGLSKFGEYPLGEITKKISVANEDSIDPEWCLAKPENMTTEKCHCGILLPKPEDVCLNKPYIRKDGCRAVKEDKGNNPDKCINKINELDNNGNDGIKTKKMIIYGHHGIKHEIAVKDVKVHKFARDSVTWAFNIICKFARFNPFISCSEGGGINNPSDVNVVIEYTFNNILSDNIWKEYNENEGVKIIDGKWIYLRYKITKGSDIKYIPVNRITNMDSDDGDLKINISENATKYNGVDYDRIKLTRDNYDIKENKHNYIIAIGNDQAENDLVEMKLYLSSQNVSNN